MKQINKIFYNFIYLLKPYWQYGKFYLIFNMILCLIVVPVNTYASVFMQQTVIDNVKAGDSSQKIVLIIIFFQALILFSSMAMPLFSRLIYEKWQIQFSAQIQHDIFKKVLRTDYKNFDNPTYFDSCALVIKEYVKQIYNAGGVLNSICGSLLTIIMLTSYLIFNSPIVMVSSVVIMLFSLWFNLKINNITMKKQERTIPYDRKMEYVQGLFCDKQYIAELNSTYLPRYLFTMYSKASGEKAAEVKKYNIPILLIDIANNTILFGLNILVMIILVWQIKKEQISTGSFVSMLTASIYLRMFLSTFFDSYKKIHECAIYSEKIQTFMNLKPNIEGIISPTQRANSSKVDIMPYSVEIRNLFFSYPNSNFQLQNINITAKKGEKIAIVGENGAGKTTITKLLLRLYDPDCGQILLNGIDLRELPIEIVRKNVGVAFQNSGIYALSFAENMSIYETNVIDNRVDEVIDLFGFENIFSKTGSSKNSTVTKVFNENGIILSGGEIQQLNLSRLFIRPFGILILDEASSALDPISEYELNKKLLKLAKNTTTIMIAHRLSSIRDADHIYVVSEGKIAEHGTHAELMSRHGIYQKMFSMQAEKYVY